MVPHGRCPRSRTNSPTPIPRPPESRFGKYQAEAYYAGLIRSFGLLADFPLMEQQVDELASGYRRFRFQSHLIFYTVQPDHVEIRAIVHGAQDIRPQLFD
jgi:toxin ParE1/3/4